MSRLFSLRGSLLRHSHRCQVSPSLDDSYVFSSLFFQTYRWCYMQHLSQQICHWPDALSCNEHRPTDTRWAYLTCEDPMSAWGFWPKCHVSWLHLRSTDTSRYIAMLHRSCAGQLPAVVHQSSATYHKTKKQSAHISILIEWNIKTTLLWPLSRNVEKREKWVDKTECISCIHKYIVLPYFQLVRLWRAKSVTFVSTRWPSVTEINLISI